MINPIECGPVADEELLARYVLSGRHVRPDGTIKPDAFIPYRQVELSVTRHEGLDETRIWAFGKLVAQQRNLLLYGRADVRAIEFLRQRLRVVPAPLHDSPNHANVVDWPADKSAQKDIAIEVARHATYTPNPE